MEQDEDKSLQDQQVSIKKEKRVIKAKAKLNSKSWVWPMKIFVLSVTLSIIFSIASEYFMSATGIGLSMAIVLLLVALAVLSDLIGVAVAVCPSHPFNSMSARKIRGAKEALILTKNASKVSVIANDVIGDICGIVAGAAGAAITGRITAGFANVNLVILVASITSAVIAGLTISGKSFGKGYAMKHSDKIVLFVGKMLSPFFKKDKKKEKKKFD